MSRRRGQMLATGWLALGAALLAAGPAQAQAPAPDSGSPTAALATAPRPRADSACGPAMRLMLPPLGDAGMTIGRLAELAGAAKLHARVINDPWSDLTIEPCGAVPVPLRHLLRPVPTGPGLVSEALPVAIYSDENSAYPRDRDNGAMWAGKGVSAAVYAGWRLGWGPLSAALAPGAIYQQNLAFDVNTAQIPGYSRYILPIQGTNIDLPQRFGDKPYWTLDPGESYLRADAFGLAAGVSTENLRFGPALRNPLMLSYAGPGFPHVFAGTSHPLNVGIGRVEARAIWGRLTESKYFDGNPSNDHRLLASLIGTFELKWLPGLYLGGTSVYEAYSPPGGFSLSDYLGALVLTPTSGVTGNKPGNGLASLFLRWALPAAGFETYAEWARDDYSFNWTSMLMEPDHSQAWTIGLQKVVPGRSHWVRIAAEATHLESSQTLRGGRGVVTMYTHSVVIQGHTNGGQMLGAPIGPGSDNQYLGVDVLGSWGTLGGYVERTGYHDDAYFNSYARSYGNSAHDVELTGGLRGSYYLHGVTLRSELGYSYRLDRSFLGLDGVNWNLRHDYNLGVRLGASWWPSLGRGPAAGVVAP